MIASRHPRSIYGLDIYTGEDGLPCWANSVTVTSLNLGTMYQMPLAGMAACWSAGYLLSCKNGYTVVDGVDLKDTGTSSATRCRFQSACNRIQNLGEAFKRRDKRRAVSAVIRRLSNAVSRGPSTLQSLRPIADRVSLIEPNCYVRGIQLSLRDGPQVSWHPPRVARIAFAE